MSRRQETVALRRALKAEGIAAQISHGTGTVWNTVYVFLGRRPRGCVKVQNWARSLHEAVVEIGNRELPGRKIYPEFASKCGRPQIVQTGKWATPTPPEGQGDDDGRE